MIQPDNLQTDILDLYRPVCPSHHWMIASPDGPISKGCCRNCGDEKVFSNFNEFASYRDYIGSQDKLGLIKNDILQTQRKSDMLDIAAKLE